MSFNQKTTDLATFTVRRPNANEYFLGKDAFIVTTPNGAVTVTYRTAACGILWNQEGGYVQEQANGALYCHGEISAILAAMNFLEAERQPQPEAKPAKTYRCPHYPKIQAFFEAARKAGLATGKESKDRSRGALGVFLNRRIESRAELTADDWDAATVGVQAGVLFW